MIPEDAIWILELIRNRDARTEAEKDAVNAAIEALKAQLTREGKTKGTTSDLISRQAVLEKVRAMQTYKLFKNDDMLLVDKAEVQTELMMLPPVQPEVLACGNGELVAQPEPTDVDAKEAVYNLAEKIGIHQLFALTVELRGEPIQPELTYEQVEEYCKKRCLHVVTDDFFESTKPQRLGHWIKRIDPFDGEQYECSECGVLWQFTDGTPEDNEAYFCPKCGAKMKGEANE